MSTTIHQEIKLDATPQRVFGALTDSAQFSTLTGGAPASIGRDEGGAFSCFGGMITGRQVELVPGKRIVQAWRAANWDEGVYSIARFDLVADGGTTRLIFDQSGFPAGQGEHLEAGWHKMYWEPLTRYLSAA